MSGSGAARDGDAVQCPHGGNLDASATDDVNINGAKAAVFGTPAGCPAQSSFVLVGAASARINGKPAARQGDRTTDGGVMLGSTDVFIGGPTAGGLLGPTAPQTSACEAAAGGRASNSLEQSYGNCGVEAWRNAINRRRQEECKLPLSEDELLADSIRNGHAKDNPGKNNHGATSANSRIAMLERHGIAAEKQSQSLGNIERGVLAGKQVQVSLHPLYWDEHHGQKIDPDSRYADSWLHEVVITGVEYDASGKAVAFIVNDTGAGVCGYRIPAARLDECLEKRLPMVVSKQRLW